jgi:ABC-type transport system involved in cytochrome bd biosynthesis fused ATPase/permease subunit
MIRLAINYCILLLLLVCLCLPHLTCSATTQSGPALAAIRGRMEFFALLEGQSELNFAAACDAHSIQIPPDPRDVTVTVSPLIS